MGRQHQSRQARRAQERRAQARGAGSGSQQRAAAGPARPVRRSGPPGGSRLSLFAGGAVVLVAIALFAFFALRGTNSSNAASPSSTAFPNGPTVKGIGCDQGMSSAKYFHIHAHLTILDNGKQEPISSDYGHFYNDDCLYWMHAHADANGIIHMESPHPIHPTLATWYKIAKLTLPKSEWPKITPSAGQQEKAWVNEKPYTGDPLKIKLYQHESVTIEFGPTFVPPVKFNFAKYQL